MFKVGDIVRRKSGSSPIRVTVIHKYHDEIEGEYINSANYVSCEKAYKFVLHEDYNSTLQKEESTTMNNTLYHVPSISDTTYATKLAVNSAGRWVMEEKGTGKIFDISASEAIEVTPYTVTIMFNNNAYDFLAKEGSLSVGDIVIRGDKAYEGSIGYVTRINSKSKKAMVEFKGRKVVTTEVEV